MEDQKSDLVVDSRHFGLSISEFLSTSNPQFKLVRAELTSDQKTTAFLFGLDLYYLSTNFNQFSTEQIQRMVIDNIGTAISDFLINDATLPNEIYYGTQTLNGLFEISDKKPFWEDGHWGVKWNPEV